jgi:NADH dehydrogenase FAD-containing subunit
LLASLPGLLDERGFVKVNKALQLEGFHHMYAVGDIVNIQEEKLAQHADAHAIVAAKNILLHHHSKAGKLPSQSSLVKYHRTPPNFVLMLVSMGPSDGIWIKGETVLAGGFIPSKMKGLVEYKIMRDYK